MSFPMKIFVGTTAVLLLGLGTIGLFGDNIRAMFGAECDVGVARPVIPQGPDEALACPDRLRLVCAAVPANSVHRYEVPRERGDGRLVFQDGQLLTCHCGLTR